jgi:hypothetical protein
MRDRAARAAEDLFWNQVVLCLLSSSLMLSISDLCIVRIC